MSNYDDALAKVKEYTANQLSTDAGCFSPDDPDSPGALLLTGVRDDLVERIESGQITVGGDANEDEVREIADAAPDVYTHKRWQEFVDLGAYQEDISEYGEPDAANLTDSVAAVALYAIAERLANALLDELATANDDDDDDEES